jgi:hypothetical protein
MITQPRCDQLRENIRNNFGSLLAERGFRQVRSDGEHLLCYKFYESDMMRIKFFLGTDEFNIELGDLDVPLIWDFKGRDGHRWYFLREIRAFLEHDSTVRIPSRQERLSRTVQVQVNEQKVWLLEHIEKIEDLFGRGRLAARQSEFEAFTQEREENAVAAMEARAQEEREQN